MQCLGVSVSLAPRVIIPAACSSSGASGAVGLLYARVCVERYTYRCLMTGYAQHYYTRV